MQTLAPLWHGRYQEPHHRFSVQAEDGVRLAGLHFEGRGRGVLLVYVHGFLANKNHGGVPRFVEALARRWDVMALDLRGHGESEGGSTMGAHEVLDVEAVVGHARALGYRRVVTVGSSMGGATVLRHAALYRSQDAVVTIGAFADAQRIAPGTDQGLRLLYGTGRVGAAWSFVTRGARLAALHAHESPLALVERIAPIPLLLIHGAWDRTVHPRAAHLLYHYAQEPKELLIVPRTGHDYPHLTEHTAARIAEWLARQGVTEESGD